MQPSRHHQARPFSDSPVVYSQKSQPPSFINLDDCKPILHSTFTNTSTSTSSHGTKAFVFTSSRTLRALQKQEDYGYHQLSPGPSVASSPATPPTPSSTSSNGRHRAQLTLSQLAKHSEGAVDARALIAPKMREAGFVNIPHTMSSCSDLGMPGTPASSSSSSFPVSALFHPTPSNPPNFPPILFVNRTAITTLWMWEYQNDLSSAGRGTHTTVHCPPPATSSNEPTPSPADPGSSAFFPPAAAHHPRRVGIPASSSSSSSDSSGLLSSSGSSSTLVSSDSSPSTGLSSVEETDEDEARVKGNNGKIKVVELEPAEYPFPPIYNHSTSTRSRGSRGSRGSRASSATASPTTIIYAGPPVSSAIDPPSPLSIDSSSPSYLRQDSRDVRKAKKTPSPRDHRSSGEVARNAKPKDNIEVTPTFATAPRRPDYQRQYSLTELCDSSPYVWLTKSDVFAPPAPIRRSPIQTPNLAPSSIYASISRPRAVIDPPPPHRRHHTALVKVPTLQSERHHRIASTPLRLPAHTHDGGLSDQDCDASSAKRATKAHQQAMSPLSGQASSIPSAAEDVQSDAVSEPDRGSSRERGRDPRGKLLGASQMAQGRAVVEKDGLAALMVAHRERDQEFARHVAADRARDKLVKQKQRAHHKLRGKLVQDYEPSESETTMVDQHTAAYNPLKFIKSDLATVDYPPSEVESVN
ncbi:hypothetical protein BN946_scf185043.g154 [Trametes cinnabarina]|uniref:Uncharacterized protein n=1 Tax=Pycnoporus cinnabarinus TaxID=5643 RepID=A0A060SPE1_PYCCI|nr:hypothetical protein BN946_scf185043.g154 [Trametes cinnabarina]